MDTESFINTLSMERPKKPMPHPLTMAGKWLGCITLYFTAITLFFGFRPDIDSKIHNLIYLLEITGILFIAITSMIAASFLSLPDIGQRPWIRFLPLFPLSVLGIFLLHGVTSENAMSLMECIKSQEYDCLISIIISSIVAGIFVFFSISRAAPTACCWAGSMAGLSVASFSYVMLRLTDTHDDPMILIVWHFIPVVLVTMTGMIGGNFLLRKTLSSHE